MPSIFQQMTRQVYNAEPYSLTGKIENIVGMSIEASGGRAAVGDICRIYNGDSGGQVTAEVVGFKNDHILLMPYANMSGISAGNFVRNTGKRLTLPVGPFLRGRVINALGQPIDGLEPFGRGDTFSIDSAYINPMTRPPIRERMEFGVKAIDSLLTIGKGQRIGIFAGSGVGKSFATAPRRLARSPPFLLEWDMRMSPASPPLMICIYLRTSRRTQLTPLCTLCLHDPLGGNKFVDEILLAFLDGLVVNLQLLLPELLNRGGILLRLHHFPALGLLLLLQVLEELVGLLDLPLHGAQVLLVLEGVQNADALRLPAVKFLTEMAVLRLQSLDVFLLLPDPGKDGAVFGLKRIQNLLLVFQNCFQRKSELFHTLSPVSYP